MRKLRKSGGAWRGIWVRTEVLRWGIWKRCRVFGVDTVMKDHSRLLTGQERGLLTSLERVRVLSSEETSHPRCH